MCRIYANTDPASYRYQTRSVRLKGYVTSLRLEKRFWDILDEMAREEGTTTLRFLGTLYDEIIQRRGEVPNFASLLRVCCTTWLERHATLAAADPAKAATAPHYSAKPSVLRS